MDASQAAESKSGLENELAPAKRQPGDVDSVSLHVHSGSSTAAASKVPEVTDTADSTVAESTRPSDEQILSFENLIKDEQRQQALLGGKESLEALEAQYKDGSPLFTAKISQLKSKYHFFRRTRQDGNCFYRSFLFSLLESLLTSGNTPATLAVIETVKSWRDKLLHIGFQELVFEDALHLFVDFLELVKNVRDPISVDELLTRLCDENTSNLIIMFVRLVTSAEIQRRSEHFMPFIIGTVDSCLGAEDFCRRFVECMGEESDNIQLVAVADAFKIPIRVVYLDNSGSAADVASGQLSCDTHEFVPQEGAEDIAGVPRVTALYRPGHYDILYE